MFDWILSQNPRNTLALHTVVHNQELKNLNAVLADQLLAVNADTVAYQMEECSTFSCDFAFLKSFPHENCVAFLLSHVLLRKKNKLNVICFPYFIMAANPACKN